jgi:hypothetical protein
MLIHCQWTTPGVHKIALLHEIALPLKFMTLYRRANTLFPDNQNAEMKP